jgi:CheY-like chemotaxis protein
MAGNTILVVEDNEIQREGTSVVLRQAGYAVVAVPEGQAALDYLLNNAPPDLILLDMMVQSPGFDGWRFMARRKNVPALMAVPVIITTALGIATDEWATSLGACGLLKKPVGKDELLEKVRNCLPNQPGAGP